MEREELVKVIRKANANGLSCAIHAIGDRAVGTLIDCYREVDGELGEEVRRGLRNRIEHFQLVRPADLEGLGRLNLFASVQPIHLCEDQGPADKWWGERARWAYAFRTISEAGGRLIFGSDAPVEPPDVLAGMYAALTRKNMRGEPAEGWHAEEKLGLDEVLRAYCVEPAVASYEENRKGVLREGYLADFVVLSADPYEVKADEIKDIGVEATVVGGEVVYGDM